MLSFVTRGSTHLTSKNLQELMKNLQVFYKCPSCDGKYRLNDIKFLGKVDSHCFMQLSCHECSLPVLATVFLSEDIQAGGAVEPAKARTSVARTDLKPREKTRFANLPPISSAEIADFHLFLSAYKGDFRKASTSSARKRTK